MKNPRLLYLEAAGTTFSPCASMRATFAALSLMALASIALADEPRATNPIGYTWIATGCENWNCAAAALVAANGDPNTIALPTSNVDFPWVILRRVVQGSIYVPPDEHFDIENFDGIADATARWASIDSTHTPILVTTTGSSKVVVWMKSGKTRAVRH